jgi:hypothetical protein
MVFLLACVNLFHRKCETFKGNKRKTWYVALHWDVEYELNRTESRAEDHYCQTQFDKIGF